MKKLVIKDIAKLAGVSYSAVSKTINNYPDISEETREKIQKIISKYNYCPSKSAQTLRSGKNNNIAFMSGRVASHFTVEILGAIEKRTFATGKYMHGIIPYSTNYDTAIMNEIFDKILYGREASAIVALAMNPPPGILQKYRKAGIPAILIENYMENAHTVNIDNKKAGFMAAEYLLKGGRKNIGIICGGLKAGSKFGYSYSAVERKAGFDAALEQYGVKPGDEYLEQCGNYTIAEGIEIFDSIMENEKVPDAIFCASGDMTAVGVMESAKKHGLKIPDDLAVVGFDDSQCSAFVNPPLTTIRQPIEEIGTEVFDMAVEAIGSKIKGFRHVVVEPELIVRKSAS
ncbi:MAG: LacI family transcriptional regulator [Spirochaetia bacterium]|nr:LacI family transcriptional regulator [Spirochaetia bacterium]